MADEKQVHAILTSIRELVDALNKDLLTARKDHPEDDRNIDSGLFQSAYSFGHLCADLDSLYELFGTSENQLREEDAVRRLLEQVSITETDVD